MPKSIFLLLLSLLFCLNLYSENDPNESAQLKKELKEAPNDSAKVDSYNKLAKYYLINHLDSVPFFAEKALEISKSMGYDKGIIRSLNGLGNFYERKTDFTKALELYEEALDLAKKNDDVEGFAILYNNMGLIYIKQGKYEEALPFMIEALKAEEALGNDEGIAQTYNNIGVVYYYQQNFDKATSYFEKSIEIKEKMGDKAGVIQAVNNLGAIYDYLKKHDNAIAQYQKALKMNRQNGDEREIGINLHNIAVSYYKKGEHSESRKYYDEALEIREGMGDKNAVALQHFNFGELLRSENKLNQAKIYYDKALEIAEEHGLKPIKQQVFGSLAVLLESQNDFKQANSYLYKFIDVKDSLLNKENSRIIAEVETKYQTEKKEKQILEQRADLAEQKLKLERRNQQLYGLILLSLFIGITGYQIYRTQKIKNVQLQKENELKAALAQIETQNQLQKERLRISRDLHDNIGSQLTFIISSIDNLKFYLKDKDPIIEKKLNGISNFTKTTIGELRGTIWAMNKGEITWDDLKVKTHNFLENAEVARPNIKFSVSFEEIHTKERIFSALEAINIYRVIQEAVNNAIKHAQAEKIGIKFVQEEKWLLIEVEDDGLGMDLDEIERGNGLDNMEKRVKELGGTLEFESNENGGTICRIKI